MKNESEGEKIEIDDLQSQDRVANPQKSPDLQLDGGLKNVPDLLPGAVMSVAGSAGVDPLPELESPTASKACSECSECPEEMAEAVYLGRVESEAAILFRLHLVACSPCRRVYEDTVQFVDAIRAAAKTLESGDVLKVN